MTVHLSSVPSTDRWDHRGVRNPGVDTTDHGEPVGRPLCSGSGCAYTSSVHIPVTKASGCVSMSHGADAVCITGAVLLVVSVVAAVAYFGSPHGRCAVGVHVGGSRARCRYTTAVRIACLLGTTTGALFLCAAISAEHEQWTGCDPRLRRTLFWGLFVGLVSTGLLTGHVYLTNLRWGSDPGSKEGFSYRTASSGTGAGVCTLFQILFICVSGTWAAVADPLVQRTSTRFVLAGTACVASVALLRAVILCLVGPGRRAFADAYGTWV